MVLPASIVEVILSYYLEKVENNTIAKLARYNKQALNKFLEFSVFDDINFIIYKMKLSAKHKIPYKKHKKIYKLYQELTALNNSSTCRWPILEIFRHCNYPIDGYIECAINIYKIEPRLFDLCIKNNKYICVPAYLSSALFSLLFSDNEKRKHIKKLVDAGINMNIYFAYYECHLLSERFSYVLNEDRYIKNNERTKNYVLQYSGDSIYPFDTPPTII